MEINQGTTTGNNETPFLSYLKPSCFEIKTPAINKEANLDKLIDQKIQTNVVNKIKGGLEHLISSIDDTSKVKYNTELLELYLFLLEWFSDYPVALAEVKTLFEQDLTSNKEKLYEQYRTLACYKLEDIISKEFLIEHNTKINKKQKVFFGLLKKFLEKEAVPLDYIDLASNLDIGFIKNIDVSNLKLFNKVFEDILMYLKHNLESLGFSLDKGYVLLENITIESLFLSPRIDNMLINAIKSILDNNNSKPFGTKETEESVKNLISHSLKSSTKSLNRIKRIVEGEMIYRIKPLLSINKEQINKLKNMYNFIQSVFKIGYILLKFNWGIVNRHFLFCLGQLLMNKWELIDNSNKFFFFKTKFNKYATKLFPSIKDLKLLTLSAFLQKLSISFKEILTASNEERKEKIKFVKVDLRRLFKEKISDLVSKTEEMKIRENCDALLNIYFKLASTNEQCEKLILTYGYKEIIKFYSSSYLANHKPKTCEELRHIENLKIRSQDAPIIRKKVKEIDKIIDIRYEIELKSKPGHRILLNGVGLLILSMVYMNKNPIKEEALIKRFNLPLDVVKTTLSSLIVGGVFEKIDIGVTHPCRCGLQLITRHNWYNEGLEILYRHIYSHYPCFNTEEIKKVIHIFNNIIKKGYFNISTLNSKDKIDAIEKTMKIYKSILIKKDQTMLVVFK